MRRLAWLMCVLVGVTACNKAENASPPISAAFDVVIGPSTDGAVAQEDAAVGFDGTSYLLVWSESRGATGYDVVGMRVSGAGETLGAPFVISAASGDQQHPAIAFDGTKYLVVWQDNRVGADKEIFGARVSPAGDVLDPSGVNVSRSAGHQLNPAVAFDGSQFLVVWDDRPSDVVFDIWGARVDANGQPSAKFAIATASGNQKEPSVACAASTCLVTWEDGRNGGSDVYGARVQNGAVLDASGIGISRAASAQDAVSVGTDGTDFLVAWEDVRNGNSDVYGARVSAAGAVLDAAGLAIARAPNAQSVPAVTFEGAYYVVVWEDYQNGTAWQVTGARVDRTGTVLDATGFAVESNTMGHSVAVASDGSGRAIVACDLLVVTDPLLPPVSRVRGRLVTVRAALSVSKTGRGSGVVTSAPGGIACGGLCSSMFDAPTDVSLVATPDAGSAFMGWAGACSGAADCTVTVDDTKSVAAKFSPYFPVSVTKSGPGAGAVQASPAGIDCGATCTAQYVDETAVQLFPTPNVGSAFGGWTGPCTDAPDPSRYAGQPYPCTLAVSGPVSVDAAFAAAYKLSVSVAGTAPGAVSGAGIRCLSAYGDGCTSYVIVNGAVTLVAAPAEGSILKSWSGSCSGTSLECPITMSSAKSVTARFEPARYPLNVYMSGTAPGTVTGGGINCTTGSADGCLAQIDNTTPSTVVTLTATPAVGSVFKAWTSGCTGQGSCSLTMSGAKTAAAKFEPAIWPLFVTVAGAGRGTVSGPDGLSCSSGTCRADVANTTPETAVTLTAAPAAGNVFKGWSGSGCSGTASCTVTMTTAKYVTATFEPATWTVSATLSGTYGAGGTITGAGLSCATGSAEGCSAAVDNTIPYSSITLEARPDASSIFKRWSGCTTATGTTCAVTMSTNKSVTAYFEPSAYRLTASVTGNGSLGGAGLSCVAGSPSGCAVDLANGATATLTATPDAGWIVKRWTGCTSSSGATCTVSMIAPKFVYVTFEPATYPVTVAASTGGGVGTVTGPGIACTTGSSSGCTAQAPNGDTITLQATPDASSLFKGWTGCTSVSGNVCTVAMTIARTVTPRFEPTTYPLTIAWTGGGGGTIVGDGITCTTASGAPCTVAAANGATVTLIASPDQSSVFKTWTGCTTVSGATCTIAMTGAKTVTATLQPAFYTLGATTSGSGSISGGGLACSAATPEGCTASVANGATVTLTATPDSGWMFKSWMGCTSSSGSSCTVSMTMARYVTATFQPAQYALNVTLPGTGAGTVTGPGITCTTGSSEGCNAMEDNGATVVLTATPADGSIFKSWGGCTTYSGSSCTVSMSTARYVTATFQPAQYALNVTLPGTGAGSVTGTGITCTTGSSAGCNAMEDNGASIVLTATPADGSILKSWTGCTSYSGSSCTVSMTTARYVTATFQPAQYPLAVFLAGTGAGSVTGPGITCTTGSSEGCSAMEDNAASVVLTATPADGSILTTWVGCTSYSGNSCTVSMTMARYVTTTFQPAM